MISQYIPEFLKDYFRIIWNNIKYPHNDIFTPNIGKNVYLGKSCSIGKDVAIGHNVIIGDFSYVNKGTLIASGTIGKFCSIAEYCGIGMVEHPINFLSTSPFLYGKKNILDIDPIWQDISHPPVIGNDVWIGAKATILQGVIVGDGVIIGAGSIVTKDIPPYSITAGAPAKVIRQRFPDSIVELLNDLKWWDNPDLHAMQGLFASGNEWVKFLDKYI